MSDFKDGHSTKFFKKYSGTNFKLKQNKKNQA